jgi:hypothetical protein
MRYVLLMIVVLSLVSCAPRESFVQKELMNMDIERSIIDLDHKELVTSQVLLNGKKKANENAEYVLLSSLSDKQVELYDQWKNENTNQPRKMLAYKKYKMKTTRLLESKQSSTMN